MISGWKLVLVMLLIFTGASRGQDLVIRLVDQNDSVAVPYAHIISSDYQTISNLEGVFQIPVRNEASTFTISCVGYEEISFKPDTLHTGSIFLTPSTEFLDPVIITSMSASDILFRAVREMREYVSEDTIRAHYWYGVVENDELKGYKVASLSRFAGSIHLDSVVVSEQCAEYELESLTNAESAWAQFHIAPPLACLNEANRKLWNYEITRTSRSERGTELVITATFISPEKHVEHAFDIWMNLDLNIIDRIEFGYVWNIDHRISVRTHQNTSSALKKLNGTILFNERMPVYLDAVYVINVCDNTWKTNCVIQEIYHELKLQQVEGLEAMNQELFDKMEEGVNCNKHVD